MLNTHKHILVYVTSSVTIFGLFWVCMFGDWHTVKALGDDSYIYLVDFDETAYDMYIQGYYPTDYTYADFRRDSIEGMVSHYVATDNNNFGAVVDTVENAVINDGWSAIKDFFENAWIDLKSGVVTVVQGFTDDFKHELDGRFKNSGGSADVIVGTGTWTYVPANSTSSWILRNDGLNIAYGNLTSHDVWVGRYLYSGNAWGTVVCSYTSGGTVRLYYNSLGSYDNFTSWSTYASGQFYISRNLTGSDISNSHPYYSSLNAALADFFGNSPSVPSGSWNGDGYYSNTPTNYSINLPALPAIDWQSISNNNKTKYGVDFPDVNVSVDFTLPDMYYPRTVTYDVPYWLQNGDETVVDWQNISFDDVTLPSLEMEDGNGGFIQHLFTALPVGFSVFLLGVLLCYLIFIML